jgi:putative endonuclease
MAIWLQSQGVVWVESNFRCKMGEIDLIMQQGELYLFIEVRYRKSAQFGGARESITQAKRCKIERTAQVYLQRFRIYPPCRFDVVLLEGDQPPEWIQQAW